MPAVLRVSEVFPIGTSVGAHRGATAQSGGPPSEAALETAVVAGDGTLTYSTLGPGDYVSYALVGGRHRYVLFFIASSAAGGNPLIEDRTITDADVALANIDGPAGSPSMRTLGTGAQQATAGNDARLTGAREPLAHAASHAAGGTDQLVIAGYFGAGAHTARPAATSLPEGSHYLSRDVNGGTLFRTTGAAWEQVAPGVTEVGGGGVALHKGTHEPGGTDALTALTAASFAATSVDGAAGVASLRTLGPGATQAVGGTDARLSDQRVPTDGSVTAVKVADALKPSVAATAGTEALRALGTGVGQAMPGNTAVKPVFVAALPGTPADGDEVFFQTAAMATNGIAWHLRYRAASTSAYKWEFVGGGPLYSEILTTETTTSATYVALATAGPDIALPLAGDYLVTVAALAYNSTLGNISYMSYQIGATAAVDADAMQTGMNVAQAMHVSRTQRRNGLTAVTLSARYRAEAGTSTFLQRVLQAVPVRVG